MKTYDMQSVGPKGLSHMEMIEAPEDFGAWVRKTDHEAELVSMTKDRDWSNEIGNRALVALKKIAEDMHPEQWHNVGCALEMQKIAREALKPTGSETDYLQRRGRDTTLECAAIRLLDSIAMLGQQVPGSKINYFEESVLKNAECQKRWLELNDAGALVKKLLADRKASEAATSEPDGAQQ